MQENDVVISILVIAVGAEEVGMSRPEKEDKNDDTTTWTWTRERIKYQRCDQGGRLLGYHNGGGSATPPSPNR
jgi:hypothetical protein